MRGAPPEVVATWPEPNYIDPETRGPELIIVEVVFLFLATICVGLRIYVRAGIMGKMETDDWLMVGALVGFPILVSGAGVTTAVLLAFLHYGWNIHVWDLTVDKMIAGRQVSFAGQGLFLLATTLAKLSILVSYLRLAPRNSGFRRATFAALAFVTITNVGFFINLFAQCVPLSSYWDPSPSSAENCNPEDVHLLANASLTAICDFIVWVVPLPAIYAAKIPRSQRIALIALFSTGLVVIVAGCVRAYWIHYVVQSTYDVTWWGSDLWMWTAVEVQLGIICGCVPWLRSLVKFWQSGRVVTESGQDYGYSVDRGGREHNWRRQTASGDTAVLKAGPVVRLDSLSSSDEGTHRGHELGAIGVVGGGSNGLSKGGGGSADHTTLGRADSLASEDGPGGLGGGRGRVRDSKSTADRGDFIDLESGEEGSFQDTSPIAYPKRAFVGSSSSPQASPTSTSGPGLAL
ncbi:hypothetical protein N658DRAFT_433124 [Parathielavia hyrcaniae]|uniref:Rhodopsin domain-containing protein n=1 Tax=Parathielavia hyrcaniae TaxID=113614 RepID=A0AAN6PU94_9PEZI|nr:hypothetical protein N658DRAFT_433124 [Parathielavia hyrcaniae]